jgi:uncharacterized protein YcsI (UPF0317 family)
MSKVKLSESDLRAMHPKEFRKLTRTGEWTDITTKVCQGYNQANLAIVPKEMAFEFLLFCDRNPRPCPVLDVTEPGDPHPRLVAPEADLRTDLPRYRVFENGKVIAEPTDVKEYWRDDLVGFLLGCSAGFDWSLRASNLDFRLIGAYTSNIECVPAGRFHGPMVISARVFKNSYDAVRATQISSRLPMSHGKPVHIGDPSVVGIQNLHKPDVAAIESPETPLKPGEIVLYWGCGITPQAVAMAAHIPYMITHYPVHMFVTDKLTEEQAIL